MKAIKVGSDFSGVGAFNQALIRLEINYKELFACDMDKYARQTFIHNYGEPEYYPMNVYDREIPSESLDIYMTSPPCQAFSSAGKRLGKDDKRGILFFNSHEFIKVNKPRFFIFENVRGLLSDDDGKTFSEWINMLGGKSVNGVPVLFPYDDAVEYHLYWKVLNAKEHGIPQNRERVFLVGIRDDQDNQFRWPIEEHLTKRLKDVLEDEVFEKYYLSEKSVNRCLKSLDNKNMLKNDIPEESRCIISGYNKIPFDGQYIKVKSNLDKYYLSEDVIDKMIAYEKRQIENGNGFRAKFHDVNELMSALKVGGGKCGDLIKIQNDKVIQLNQSKESRGQQPYQQNRVFDINGISPAILANLGGDRNHNILYTDKRLNETIQQNPLPEGQVKAIDLHNRKLQDNSPTLTEPHHNNTRLWDGYRVRRLTPRECFRLMDFPDTFTWPVSDSQAYKQAGNSIVVRVLEKIIKNLPL